MAHASSRSGCADNLRIGWRHLAAGEHVQRTAGRLGVSVDKLMDCFRKPQISQRIYPLA
jgi:hypothetical protein